MESDGPMKNYFRPSLMDNRTRLGNYGHRDPAPCDLSLVSGPFIWGQEAARALAAAEPADLLNSYMLPGEDPELVRLIAEMEGVQPDWIRLTAGADMGLEVVLRQLLGKGDHLAILTPNFPRFALVAHSIEGVTLSQHTAMDDIPDDCRLVAVCTPNNPSTEELPLEDLRRLITRHADKMVCLDGVFDWYGSHRLADLCREFPNVVLLKSFSKLGLAGLRLGYMVSRPFNMECLGLGQSPFSVPALVQRVGREVIGNIGRVAELREILERGWEQIHAAFGGSAVRHSPVPFYLLQLDRESAEGVSLLAQEGISVVDSVHFHGLDPNVARVALGTPEQNACLIKAVEKLGILR